MKYKYQKGTFIVVPNKEALKGAPSYVQTVYFWICNYANEEGICFPSRTTIAENAGCSVRSVDRALELLCALGFLEKETRKDPKNHNKNLTNVYQLMITDGSGAGAALPRAGGAPGGGAGVAQRTQSSNNSNNLKAADKSAEPPHRIVSDTEARPKQSKDHGAMRLREKLYDMFEEEYQVRPLATSADYQRVLAALKVLSATDVEDLVEEALQEGKVKTVREALTNRAIDVYRQENV